MVQKKTFLLLFSLNICFLTFYAGTSYSQNRNPLDLQDFDGFTNQQYANWLAQDGWPVEKLNSGANVEFLSDAEKNLILAMNIIRFDPPKYSRLYIYPRLQYFQGTSFHFPGKVPLRTKEGIEAVRELYLELLDTKPMEIFIPSRGISRASKDHAVYLKNTGQTSHEGQGGMSARISKYGQWKRGIAENLQWAASNAHEAVVSLMIDDGIRSRGHRKNILNPAYRLVGVGVEPHPRWQISYVINYAVEFIEK